MRVPFLLLCAGAAALIAAVALPVPAAAGSRSHVSIGIGYGFGHGFGRHHFRHARPFGHFGFRHFGFRHHGFRHHGFRHHRHSRFGLGLGYYGYPSYPLVVERPAPVVVQQPAPVVVVQPAQPMARVASLPPGDCLQAREYQTRIVVGGETVDAYGVACLQQDGSWRRGPAQSVPR